MFGDLQIFLMKKWIYLLLKEVKRVTNTNSETSCDQFDDLATGCQHCQEPNWLGQPPWSIFSNWQLSVSDDVFGFACAMFCQPSTGELPLRQS